jgi:hypothetical protein
MTPNKFTGANNRPASPLDAGQEFASVSCAPPPLSAAVAQLCRSARNSQPPDHLDLTKAFDCIPAGRQIGRRR